MQDHFASPDVRAAIFLPRSAVPGTQDCLSGIPSFIAVTNRSAGFIITDFLAINK
jgi:hypothetical protein